MNLNPVAGIIEAVGGVNRQCRDLRHHPLGGSISDLEFGNKQRGIADAGIAQFAKCTLHGLEIILWAELCVSTGAHKQHPCGRNSGYFEQHQRRSWRCIKIAFSEDAQ